jgi:hypothetical protein
MKSNIWIGLVVLAAAVGGFALGGDSPKKDTPAGKEAQKVPSPTSNQVLMRKKLVYANQALDGLAQEDFGKIAESANLMKIISRAASWHVVGSEEYARYSKDFQEQAGDLERHAKEKNLDAASLDYVRITLTCVQCHKYLRAVRGNKKP